MPYFDLSYCLKNGMPYYPGTEAPNFKQACSIEKHGFKETRLNLLSHIGTHADAPAHIFEHGACIDELPVSHFAGKAFILDASDTGNTINVRILKTCEDELKQADFLLLHTAWSRFWGSAEYFADFPVLSSEATAYLSQKNLRGLGLDTISIDAPDNEDLTNHKIILKANRVVIENLNIPEVLTGRFVDFFAFPLRIEKGDGSPIRAVARL